MVNEPDKTSFLRRIRAGEKLGDIRASFQPVLASLLVLVVALWTMWQLWTYTKNLEAQEAQEKFNSQVREIADRIEDHLASYVLAMRGAAGLFAASSHVDRNGFRDYIGALNLQGNYPGVQGVGYSITASGAERTAFAIDREPSRGSAPAMREDSLCRAAMEHVRDPGKVFITGKLQLEDGQTGFLICAPIYLPGARRETAELRRANIAGWVYMRFGMETLMFGILGNDYRESAIAIHDGEEVSDENLMYRNGSIDHAGAPFRRVKHIEVAGHYWTLSVARENAGMAGTGEKNLVLYTGIGISLLLSLLAWLMLEGRANAVEAAERLSHELAERQKAEEELRFAATVYGVMDEAVTITDADNKFVSVNPAFTLITGYSKEEVLGKDPHILASGVHSREFYREMWASLEDTGAWQGEISNRRRSGEVYVEWLSIKRINDERGKPLHYIGVFSDISKRKAAETLLRESSETLSAIIETAMDAVVLIDAHGSIIDWNGRAEDILGWTREEARGQDLQNMIATLKYLDGSVSSLRQFLLLRNGTALHSVIETTAIHRDGHELPVELTLAQIRIKGKRAFSCFIHDVSARHKRDEALHAANLRAEAASRAKSEFLANMSHEIRTPMNSILGMAYLALKTDLTSKQRDYLEKIHYSGQHLLGIINDILDFSKIEAGKLEIETVDLNLGKIIENVTNMLGGKAAEKGLALEFQIDADVPLHLRGDPLRLGQVLINYVSNAIKFTAQGEVAIHVGKAGESASNILLRFEVRDSGIGIGAEEKSSLFQVFQQADTSTTRKFGGTGLGLAISKQLAELMGGEVGVESEAGHGSTFWFTASLEKTLSPAPGDNEPEGQLPEEQDAKRALGGAKILLVEDNPFNQLVATDLLEQVGVAVAIAGNGKEALDLLRQERFDCVLMDMQMPEMDGLEATRRIRADAAMAGTPIIAMTANTRNEDRQRCIEAGMDDLITKPILPGLLYATLAGRLADHARSRDSGNDEAAGHPAKPAGGAAAGKPVSAPDGMPGDPEIIDLAVLAGMVGHDREKVRKYAVKFLASAQQGLNELEAALKSGDMKALAALGHRIKSSARTVGAIGFANRCQALEQSGLGLEQAEGIIADMVRLLVLIKEQIEGVRDE